jgi:hypothetical protein
MIPQLIDLSIVVIAGAVFLALLVLTADFFSRR